MKFHHSEDYSLFEEKGFNADLLDRSETKRLINIIINQSTGGLVLGLDAEWGIGKTTFVKMLESDLKDKEPFIYFDAYKSDFHNDAITAIAGEIYEKAETLKVPGDGVMQDMVQAVGKLSSLSLSGSINALLRITSVLLARQLGTENFDAIANDVAGDLFQDLKKEKETSLTGKNKHIKNYKEEKDALKSVYTALERLSVDIINTFNQPIEDDQKKAKNLVFVIDELDRCRPEYALSILESIKHLFLVPNIIFILVTNKQQLAASIQGIHGPNFNAEQYLEKFIHVNIDLPPPSNLPMNSDIAKYIDIVSNDLEINLSNSEIKILAHLTEYLPIPPRQISKVIVMITILKELNNQYLFDPDLKQFCFFISALNICNKEKLKTLKKECEDKTHNLNSQWLFHNFDTLLLKEPLENLPSIFGSGSHSAAIQQRIIKNYLHGSNPNSSLKEVLLMVIRSINSFSLNS